MRLGAVIAIAGLAACYRPSVDDCGYRCANARCPEGLQCDGEFCRVPGYGGACQDAGVDTAVDAPVDAFPWDAPWGVPKLIYAPANASEPMVFTSLTTMYYTATNATTGEASFYQVTRANPGVLFTTPVLVPGLDLAGPSNRAAHVSVDALTVYFGSTRAPAPAGTYRIWQATRATTSAAWSTPTLVPELNSTASDWSPSMTADGLSIAFTSNRLGDFDLYESTRASINDPWGAPVRIAELATSNIEGGPSLSADGLTLYFHSTRTGDYEIFYAHRDSLTSPFGAPISLSFNVAAKIDVEPQITPDDRHLYFASDRGGAGLQIFEVTR